MRRREKHVQRRSPFAKYVELQHTRPRAYTQPHMCPHSHVHTHILPHLHTPIYLFLHMRIHTARPTRAHTHVHTHFPWSVRHQPEGQIHSHASLLPRLQLPWSNPRNNYHPLSASVLRELCSCSLCTMLKLTQKKNEQGWYCDPDVVTRPQTGQRSPLRPHGRGSF